MSFNIINKNQIKIVHITLLFFAYSSVHIGSLFSIEYIIDYDDSFGKTDKHYMSFYKFLFKHINTNIQLPNNSLDPKFVSALDRQCRMLYHKNYPFNLRKRKRGFKQPRIPLLVHQIWLGSPFPEKYRKWQQTWQNLGNGWTYKLWTEQEVKELKLFNQAIYDQETNFGAKSDILRMEILYKYGGLYIDTDFECLNPSVFLELHYNLDFYTAFHPADCLVYLLANGLVAATPKHPVIKGYIDELPIKYKLSKSFKEIIATTGPGFFTQMFLKYTNPNFRDIAFPPSFVYPLGHLLPPQALTFEAIKKSVIKPESFAIHWWESSWVQQ